MVAGLHGDHRDGAGGQTAGPAQGYHLGVVAAGGLGTADADDPALGVHNHRPDGGFGYVEPLTR